MTWKKISRKIISKDKSEMKNPVFIIYAIKVKK